VLWNFVTATHVGGLEISGQGTNDSLVAQPRGEGRFEIRRLIVDPFVYRISIRPLDGPRVTLPTLHALQVRRDTPPRLTWKSPAVARTSLTPAPNLPRCRSKSSPTTTTGWPRFGSS
jgi:hypothetical protein